MKHVGMSLSARIATQKSDFIHAKNCHFYSGHGIAARMPKNQCGMLAAQNKRFVRDLLKLSHHAAPKSMLSHEALTYRISPTWKSMFDANLSSMCITVAATWKPIVDKKNRRIIHDRKTRGNAYPKWFGKMHGIPAKKRDKRTETVSAEFKNLEPLHLGEDYISTKIFLQVIHPMFPGALALLSEMYSEIFSRWTHSSVAFNATPKMHNYTHQVLWLKRLPILAMNFCNVCSTYSMTCL